MRLEPPYANGDPVTVATVDLGGMRTGLAVPLVSEEELTGAIVIYRQEERLFDDKQIALVSNFAKQAVVAIENARLFEELEARTRELQDALCYQTATSDVLNVISRSPSAIQPVLDTIAQTAGRLCEAYDTVIFLREGKVLKAAAHVGPIRADPEIPIGAGWVTGRAVITGEVIHVHDIASAREEFPDSYDAGLRFGSHSTLACPLRQDPEAIGVILVRRTEIRPFSPKQIELLQTFADQAVIAINNVTLFEEVQARTAELTDALEQQTATSEVLEVISGSPGELEPVFGAMLEKATRICEAQFGNLFIREEYGFRAVAMHGPAEYLEYWRQEPSSIDLREHPSVPIARAAATKAIVHIRDLREERAYIDRDFRMLPLVNFAGARTLLIVPMMKDEELIGAINIYRQEVQPFSEKQIELLSSFAKQAVIAIENTRLLKELRETLQQQTATADVLQAISRSTFDLETVLQTLVKSAARLCDADRANITREKNGTFYRAEGYGFSREFQDYVRNTPVKAERGSAFGRALLEARAVHIPDVLADPEYTYLEGQRLGDYRTVLAVPMLRENVSIGVLSLTRSDMRPFTDRQIELATTFADQAAIAIENARLFEKVQARTRELQESLEYQTATSEVLNVISRSPTNAQPVFDAIVESASRLCEAIFGVVWRYDGDLLHYAASHNFTPEVLDRISQTYPKRADRSVAAGRAILDCRVAHVPDMLADREYAHELALAGNWRASDSSSHAAGRQAGRRDLDRQSRGGAVFERQIQLSSTFADQAVIAIENVRLFEEVQARTAQLTKSLEYQTATSDVLNVISRSPSNIQPVLDAIAETATHLCKSDFAFVYQLDGGAFHVAATNNAQNEWVEYVRNSPRAPQPRYRRGPGPARKTHCSRRRCPARQRIH